MRGKKKFFTGLRAGENPRDVLSRHRERGFHKFYYTYEDLADLFGVSIQHVRNLAFHGKLKPNSLQSVIEYYLKRKK